MRDRVRVYLEIWSRIEDSYFNGYMVSERGLQAALYAELRQTLPGVHVVVEPRWVVWVAVGSTIMIPDIVLVEKGQITDIFELKFVPHDCAPFEEDIRRLLLYRAIPYEEYRVHVRPNTGQWAEEEKLPVRNNCRLHFVAVSCHRCKAVWPKDLVAGVPELQNNPGRLNHWFGRVGGDTDENREWSIAFGI